jgi:Cu2+-exporting ATPase
MNARADDSATRFLDALAGTKVGTDPTNQAVTACFHCGLDVPPDSQFTAEIDGRMEPMCCVGCMSIAQTIVGAGMADFYRHRVGFSEKLDPRSLPLPSIKNQAAVDPAKPYAPADAHLYVTGLRCTACVWLAERALGSLRGVESATVNLTTQSARVRFDQAQINTEQIVASLAAVGLGAELAEHQTRMLLRRKQRRTQLLEFGVAGLCMMQVMMLVVPIYLADASDISPDAKQLMAWTAWLLTLPVLLFSARPIFTNAFRTAFHTAGSGYLGMDVPVALALLLTFIASTTALITQSGQHYFDAITMFVFLLLGARWLESSLRLRTADTIDRLSNARPLECQRLLDFPRSEQTQTVRADQLAVGDMVSIRPGESVPADAVVVRGESDIDEALMTGESRPVTRRAGDPLIGGTINTSSPLIAQATAVGNNTLLARLGKMVESSLGYRPAFHGLADRAARWLAPATLLASAAAALVWWQIDPSRAAEVAIAVLAITCPCAFALAAPAALASALASLTRDGLLVARAHLVETMAGATDVVFDKTGTLTTGEMRVTKLACEPEDLQRVLALAAALEHGAIHPAARAIQTYAATHRLDGIVVPVAKTLTMVAGQGIEAVVDGGTYRLGKPEFAVPAKLQARFAELSTSLSDTETHIALCGVTPDEISGGAGTTRPIFAVFSLADPIRHDAAVCVAALRSHGIRVHLLSGDSANVVDQTAKRLGIESRFTRSAQTAEQKRLYVGEMAQRGAQVVAVGDGVNDAPMLAAATGSIGLAHGATLTRLSADAVLASQSGQLLTCLANAFVLSRRARGVIRQNLLWALVYNVVAVPIAFAGHVTPLVAAFGMAISSLVVVINASRLGLGTNHHHPASVRPASA